mmetsp:Transcript_23432/g.51803  ORF Transcript_23432/g.51803 Transcript_23432/m.51803 type:complete len:347 (+) Transcript_23432:141-1181(+)
MAEEAPSCEGASAEGAPQVAEVERILAASGLFAALGLADVCCEPATIKTRYRQLALQVHPDKCGDPRAKAAFQKISTAFETLNTSEAQERYLRNQCKTGAGRGGRRSDKRSAAATQSGSRWWDTRTWVEFERRFRRREAMEAALKVKFLSQVQGKFQHRKLRRQVICAEKACEQLDRARDMDESDLWPPEMRELPNKVELQIPAFEGAKTAWDELMERNELEDSEYCANRLVDLLTHLRAVHVYCLHCGCHFEGAEDLEGSCPGFDEDAHENAENMAMRQAPPEATRELAPPPKKPRGPPPSAPIESDDADPLNAFLAAGARKTPGSSGKKPPGPQRSIGIRIGPV